MTTENTWTPIHRTVGTSQPDDTQEIFPNSPLTGTEVEEVLSEGGWLGFPAPNDIFEPWLIEFPIDEWWYLHDPIEDELIWSQEPLADDVFDPIQVSETADFLQSEPEDDPSGDGFWLTPYDIEDFLLGATSEPEDIELLDEIPLEESTIATPIPDDVEDFLLGAIVGPDDIELLDETPLEDSWVLAPVPDDVVDFLLAAISEPEDIELFDEAPLEDSWILAPAPDDVVDFLLAAVSEPEDLELWDEVPLEESTVATPIPDDIVDPGLGVSEQPWDDWWYVAEELPEDWVALPAEEIVEETLLGIRQLPDDSQYDDDSEESLLYGPIPEEPGPVPPGIVLAGGRLVQERLRRVPIEATLGLGVPIVIHGLIGTEIPLSALIGEELASEFQAALQILKGFGAKIFTKISPQMEMIVPVERRMDSELDIQFEVSMDERLRTFNRQREDIIGLGILLDNRDEFFDFEQQR